MTEVISNGELSCESAEEGEIRDSEEEKRRPAPRKNNVRRRRAPARSPVRSHRKEEKRKPVKSKSPRHRKRRQTEESIADDEDDIEVQLAKTRRRMQQEALKNPLLASTTPVPLVEKETRTRQDDEVEVLEVPPKTFELVQIDDDDAASTSKEKPTEEEDVEREQELLQLRLVALKSSIEAKWGHRKKKQIDEPYSPTMPLEEVEDVDDPDSPAPSPPQSPTASDHDSEEDEENLRIRLLQQMKKDAAKASEDKENESCQIEGTNEVPTMGPPASKVDTAKTKEVVTSLNSSLTNGRFIISIGPDSSDSESESDKESSKISDTDIDQMLKKLRENAEQTKKRSGTPARKVANARNRKSPARQVTTPISKNDPLSVLPKSRQAEYLRLKALLKKKEELRRQRMLKKEQQKAETANKEPQLPSLNALSQSLPLLSEEQRIERLKALEADHESQKVRCQEQEERLAALVGRFETNKNAQQEVSAEAAAAESRRVQQEETIALLRRRLAEAEAAAAAAEEQSRISSQKLEQLRLEEEALAASVRVAGVEAARLRAGCALLREACSQARGDNEVKVLEQQLDVLGALASGPLSYHSPLDHIRNISSGALDPNQEVCPEFLSGNCHLGARCTLQHP